MNKLSRARNPGSSRPCRGKLIRSTVRMTGVAKNTIVKLLVELGEVRGEYQDRVMRNLPCGRLQCDEVWAFCYSKQRNAPEEHMGEFGYGDVWTWTAIDADTELIPTLLVGLRDVSCANAFIEDLAGRLSNRLQLTTDGLKLYPDAIEGQLRRRH